MSGRNGSISSISSIALLAIAVFASRAAVAQEAHAVRLEYAVSGACPDEAAFVAAVRGRTAHFRAATNTDASVATWNVSVRREANGIVTGQLTMRDGAAEASTRDVSGDTCGEVVSALSLIGALAIDPNAASSPAARPPASSAATAPAPGPARSPDVAARPSEERRGWEMGLGADAELLDGVAPTTAPAFGGFVEWRARRPGTFSPTLRAGFERSLEATTTLSNAESAAFVLTMATLDLCPSRWSTGAVSLTVCLRGELGALHGEGRNISPVREEAPPWFAVDALARGELALARPLFLEAAAGARAPLLRTRYVFEPDTTVFRAAAVGWFAGAGAAVRFL